MTVVLGAAQASRLRSRRTTSVSAAWAATSRQRQQRTRCSAVGPSTGGNSSEHFSTAQLQRGVKAQPGGRWPGRGAQPGMPLRARSPVMSGIEESSLRV